MPVRRAQDPDVERLAVLCEQLGYSVTVDAVRARLARLAANPEHAVFVAEDAGRVTGWVHVFARELLESARHAEIGGLVVDAEVRGTGTGRQLMVAAEDWARAHECRYVSLRSNVIRTGAHEFYKRLGYEITKQSLTFRKTL